MTPDQAPVSESGSTTDLVFVSDLASPPPALLEPFTRADEVPMSAVHDRVALASLGRPRPVLIEFNRQLLADAFDERTALLERVTFLSYVYPGIEPFS